ncbi:hypothetical protein SDJN02_27352, partial [Cucurbita argyrosperma subsp. argyrosperma]
AEATHPRLLLHSRVAMNFWLERNGAITRAEESGELAGADRRFRGLSNTCFANSMYPVSCFSLLLRFVRLHSTTIFRSSSSDAIFRSLVLEIEFLYKQKA